MAAPRAASPMDMTAQASQDSRRRSPGVSLVELVIAMAVLSIGVLSLLGAFRYLGISAQTTKGRSLAANLAQEQVEVMKAKSYYSLLVTTAPFNDTRFSPALEYDMAAYPPESLVEGGLRFTRAVRVDSVFQDGANLTVVPWTSDDTGLKQVTVYVLWLEGGAWKFTTLQNLVGNVSTNPLNARISGTVTRQGTGAAVGGARVQVIDNPNLYGTSNASGNYTFLVSAGSYTVTCSSTGFFPGTTSSLLSVAAGATVASNFVLTAMGSYTVTTDVYVRDHVVISQVVASTGDAGDIEYVELYNPTPNPIPMGKGDYGVNPDYWTDRKMYLYTELDSDHEKWVWAPTFVSTFIPPYGYYLIANTTTVTAAGVTRTADALYDEGWRWEFGSWYFEDFMAPNEFIYDNERGYLGLVILNNGLWQTHDRLGWCKGGSNPVSYETACRASAAGIQTDEQFVRLSTPGYVSATYGSAYDSDDNSVDFAAYLPITVGPRNTTVIRAPLAGSPAFGAWVGLTDPLSTGGNCASVVVSGGCRACRFTAYAATGTWNAEAFVQGLLSNSGSYYKQISTIAVTSATSFPKATTTPAWPVANHSYTVLDSTTSNAYFAGTVYNIYGSPLNGILVRASGGSSQTTGTNGRYFVYGPSGASAVTANPGNTVSTYSSETWEESTVAGGLYDPRNLYLSQIGSLRGYIRTSSNQPLPGRVFVALVGAAEEGQAASDNSGNFYLRNLTTGTYVVVPSLDPIETVSPSSATVTLATAGSTVFVATFTVSSGLAEIRGRARAGTSAINTGALVLATTGTLGGTSTSPPPSISGIGSCAPCYYGALSDPEGNYSIKARSSGVSYNVYGWYTTFSGSTPTTTRIGPFAVSLSTPSAVATRDLTW